MAVALRILHEPAKRLRAKRRLFRCHDGGVGIDLVLTHHRRGIDATHQIAGQCDVKTAQRRRLVTPVKGQRLRIVEAVKLLQRHRIAFGRLNQGLLLAGRKTVGFRPVDASAEPGERAGIFFAPIVMPAERLRRDGRFVLRRIGDEFRQPFAGDRLQRMRPGQLGDHHRGEQLAQIRAAVGP